MMRIQILLINLVLPILVWSLLTGCGSSLNTDLESNTTTSIEVPNTQTEETTREIISTEENISTLDEEVLKTKGYLIDSPLWGVNYECDNEEALTDSNGTFECIAPPVTFRIGQLTLGRLNTFTADGKVYPQDLLGLDRANYSDDRLKLLARLMQSLDDDGDIETQITITLNVRDALDEEQNFSDMSERDVELLVNKLEKNLVTECRALEHLGASGVHCNSDGSYYLETSSATLLPTSVSSEIRLLSPTVKTVDYNYVTLEVDGNIEDITAIVNGVEYEGAKESSDFLISKSSNANYKTLQDSFFIYNIALQSGKNSIELITNGGRDKRVIEIDSNGKGLPPVAINADKREGFEKLDTLLSVQTTLDVNEYMLDRDGDKTIDEIEDNASFSVTYNQEGRFFPLVTVRTEDGTLYSTQQNISIDVKTKPMVKTISSLSNLDVIDMQISSIGKYYIMTSDNIYELNSSNDIVNTITIPNSNAPEGFFVDLEENIFIANTGANKIIRLSKDNNYQQTMEFGTAGSENAQFNQPKDLVVESSGEQQKIYVLDSGNNRVQVFNYVGAYLYSFDGSTTPTGKLNNPTSMIGYFAQPLVIVDAGNGLIRTLQCSEGQVEHEVNVIRDGISSNIGKITIGGDLIVPDKGAKKILFFQNNAWLKKSLEMDKVPTIAISNDGLDLLIVNDGESGVLNATIAIDPVGAEPIDVAKEFVQALTDGDRATVERVVGNNAKILDIIYGDQTNLNSAIDLYKQITTWHSQTYHTSSYATVKAHIKTATDEFDATFELTVADEQINTSRVWIVKRFY